MWAGNPQLRDQKLSERFYLGLLVVFVLDAVDLLKQIAHPVNLGKKTIVGVPAALSLLLHDNLPSSLCQNVHITPTAASSPRDP